MPSLNPWVEPSLRIGGSLQCRGGLIRPLSGQPADATNWPQQGHPELPEVHRSRRLTIDSSVIALG